MVYVVRGTLRSMKKPTVLDAKSPADLLAAIPCILEFQPEESLVMLTVGAGQACHARVDLPVTPDEVTVAVECLVRAAVTNRVGRVVIVAYTANREAASSASDALAFSLAGQGFEVADMLRVDGDRFWPWWPGERDRLQPERFDPQSHRFRAEAVIRGRVIHGSRAELAATIAPRPATEVHEALAQLDAAVARVDADWLRTWLPRLARADELPRAEDSARVLLAVRDPELVEVAVMTMAAVQPDSWVDLWSHLTRCAPTGEASGAAGLLSFAAWRAGHGALAWCAVDRCREVEPDNPLAGMVAGLLEHAVPPSLWA